MIMRSLRPSTLLMSISAAMLLAACSSENKPAHAAQRSKPVEQKSEFPSVRLALQRLYTTARGWTSDAEPLRLDPQYRKVADLPVNYVLDWDPRRSELIWHVIYGQNSNDPDLQIAVDASSGSYIRKES